MHRIATTAIVISLWVAPNFAAAQGLGRIEARIGETELRWHTITTERTRGTEARAGIRFGPQLTGLEIHGYPGAEFTSTNAISVDVRDLGQYAPDAVPMSVDILHMPDGMGRAVLDQQWRDDRTDGAGSRARRMGRGRADRPSVCRGALLEKDHLHRDRSGPLPGGDRADRDGAVRRLRGAPWRPPPLKLRLSWRV